ncbi:DUF3098 domain-containing protein [Flavimarina sp. Hel_I_48]|uniref:DUF3098 domain-containing protein n=1 Tax=Flavimarina sp. Hel_I_48 TaxID=1392488 RepID=UPI00068FE1B7|nr:DUF3098 domain-containing protein [Flavimarina sp. Hel_I_48]
MGEQKRKKNRELHRSTFVFGRKNYKFMLIGLGVITLGFLLMAGGGSDDPTVFNPEIYSWRRIRLAPALVLIGFGIEVYAILLNPTPKAGENLNDTLSDSEKHDK